MSQLSEQALLPCDSNCQPLDDSRAGELLQQLDKWQIIEDDGVKQLARAYRFSNFVQALGFAQRVGALAEEEDHHPVICIEWGEARVRWWTHSLSGLFTNDFIMAARCDALYPGADNER